MTKEIKSIKSSIPQLPDELKNKFVNIKTLKFDISQSDKIE